MKGTSMNPQNYAPSKEHGRVVRATKYWGCSEFGYEYWETYLVYEDGFVEVADTQMGDHYD